MRPCREDLKRARVIVGAVNMNGVGYVYLTPNQDSNPQPLPSQARTDSHPTVDFSEGQYVDNYS